MDYKFVFLLLISLILFYIYNQVDAIRDDVNELSNKYEELSKKINNKKNVEKKVEKKNNVQKKQVNKEIIENIDDGETNFDFDFQNYDYSNQKFDISPDDILEFSNQNNEVKEVSNIIEYSDSEDSDESDLSYDEVDNHNLAEYSNEKEVNSSEKFETMELDLDNVMDKIMNNSMNNNIQTEMTSHIFIDLQKHPVDITNPNYKSNIEIEELSDDCELVKSEKNIQLKESEKEQVDDESEEATENLENMNDKILDDVEQVEQVKQVNEKSEIEVQNNLLKQDINLENNETIHISDDIINNEEINNLIEKNKDNSKEKIGIDISNISKLNLPDLQNLASKYNIDLLKESKNGKKKNKTKRELRLEIKSLVNKK